jgi:hypothetical protein
MSYISGYCIFRNRKIIPSPAFGQISSESVSEFLGTTYDKLGLVYPRFYKMDNQSGFGLLASEILLRENPVTHHEPDAIAVVLSNANASLDADIRFDASARQAASPSLFVYTLPNIVTGEICIRHGITGENAFFVTPGFNASLMRDYVEEVLLHGHSEACIAGWVDVVGEQHDVLLYLVEKQKRGMALAHSAEELKRIYCQ